MGNDRRKKEDAPKGRQAPWLLTYGDMMTLLLCFFVLLFAMSKIEEERVKTIFESIRAFFDIKATVATGPLPEVDTFEEIMTPGPTRNEIKGRKHGERAVIQHGLGEDIRVQWVDEGLKIEIGGRTMFAPGSAQIREEGKEKLYKICRSLAGQRLRVDVRGHTSRGPADLPEESLANVPPGKWNEEKWDLSWERAFNVAYYLSHECTRPGSIGQVENYNIDWERLRITACADTQPVVLNLYDRLDPEERLGIQRRVEIILSDEPVPYGTEGPRKR
ncbi:MAG: flagellar motor protein MotB [Planctomycetota bacterium]|jgi:chemotaxis protein MotB